MLRAFHILYQNCLLVVLMSSYLNNKFCFWLKEIFVRKNHFSVIFVSPCYWIQGFLLSESWDFESLFMYDMIHVVIESVINKLNEMLLHDPLWMHYLEKQNGCVQDASLQKLIKFELLIHIKDVKSWYFITLHLQNVCFLFFLKSLLMVN